MSNENGFTLMEAVISIAVLAIISGFILQMFIVSNNVNNKAGDIDSGNSMIFTAVELFKKNQSMEEFLKEDFFSGSTVINNNYNTTIYKCYDKSYNQIPDSDFTPEDISEDVRLVLLIDIKRGKTAERAENYVEDTSRLDVLEATVICNEKGKDKEPYEVVSIQASKFFAK